MLIVPPDFETNTAQNSPKHAISSEKFIFGGLCPLSSKSASQTIPPEGGVHPLTPDSSPLTKPSGSDPPLRPQPEFQPDLYAFM